MLDNAFIEWAENQTLDLKKFKVWQRPSDLIEGVIPSGSIVLLSGEPKAGKSFIAQAWAFSVATGSNWNGHPAERGSVLYLYPDGEHLGNLYKRFHALEIGNNLEWESDYLRTLESFKFSDKKATDKVLSGLDWAGLKLVVIDTLAAAAGGVDLNSQKDIAPIAEFAKTITTRSNSKTSVLIVHHAPKANVRGVSGSTQVAAMASVIYSMTNQGAGFTLTCEKARDSASDFKASFKIALADTEAGERLPYMVATNEPKSEQDRAFIEKHLPELLDGSKQTKSYLSKALQERAGMTQSPAYRWVDNATSRGSLVRSYQGNVQVFSIPSSQTFPQGITENEQTTVPTFPPLLEVGKREQAGELF